MIRVKPSAGGQVNITFALSDPPPGHTSVVGCFNNWTPGRHRLVKRSNGTWSTAVRVDTGATLCFRYLASDGVWFDDGDTELARDDRGQLISV
jgi:1,4-alpha-glucan branching enzyme